MRTHWLVAAGTAVSLGGGVLAAVVMQPPSAVTVDSAVKAFRAHEAPTVTPRTGQRETRSTSSSSSHTNASGVAAMPSSATRLAAQSVPVGLLTPREGVYSYATNGEEQVNRPSKTTHTYPSVSAGTVAGSTCDAHFTWQPIEGRRLDFGGCYDHGAFRLSSMTTTQTFFGYRNTLSYKCAGENVAMPAQPKAGARWSFPCKSDKTQADVKMNVLEPVTRVIGGVKVATWHVRFAAVIAGGTRGTIGFDFWFAARDALPIAIDSATDVVEDTPFGAVHYVEAFSLALARLQPQT